MASPPNSFNIMYASAWEKDRKAWNLDEDGKSSAIYKSIDGGETWNKISEENSGFQLEKVLDELELLSMMKI
jgi:photosystem II stability/assembly factor-like uncharacterized protein